MHLKSYDNLITFLKTGAKVFFCLILYMSFWVLTTPLCFVILKSTKPLFRILCLIPLLGLIGYLTGFLSLWLLSLPLLCTELALFIENTKKIKNITWLQLLVLLIGSITHLLIFLGFELLFPKAFEQSLLDWFTKIDEFWINLMLKWPSDVQSSDWLNYNWSDYLGYMASIYFVSLVLGVFACFWGTRLLKKFKVPDFLFWLTVICFGLGFLRWESLLGLLEISDLSIQYFKSQQIYFQNVSIILSSLYFFQGLSVSAYLMENFKIARFWQNLWYILIILNMPLILVVLGLVDFVFEFRSFKEMK